MSSCLNRAAWVMESPAAFPLVRAKVRRLLDPGVDSSQGAMANGWGAAIEKPGQDNCPGSRRRIAVGGGAEPPET
jgi:hypothetical protein